VSRSSNSGSGRQKGSAGKRRGLGFSGSSTEGTPSAEASWRSARPITESIGVEFADRAVPFFHRPDRQTLTRSSSDFQNERRTKAPGAGWRVRASGTGSGRAIPTSAAIVVHWKPTKMAAPSSRSGTSRAKPSRELVVFLY